MNKLAQAYELGVQQALFDAGLVKEGGIPAPGAAVRWATPNAMKMIETGVLARQSSGVAPKYLQHLEKNLRTKIDALPPDRRSALLGEIAKDPAPVTARESAERFKSLFARLPRRTS